jgi:hypothetical protein
MSSTEHLLAGTPAIEHAYPERALIRHYPSFESLSDSELSTTSSNSGSGTTISSRSSISLEKEKNQIAEKKGIHGLRALRYRFFCIYRRLSTVVFGNITAMVLILISPKERQLDILAIAMAANLTASVLVRQNHIVNLLYNIASSVPKSSPLWFRRRCAQIYHIGKLYSSFAVGSVFWLLTFTVLATIQRASLELLVITYFIDTLLLVILVLAHPTFRVRFHDHFEMTHRFAGCTSLFLFWIQTVLFVSSHATPSNPFRNALLRSPNIWLLAITTASILFPWLELRKVQVNTIICLPMQHA